VPGYVAVLAALEDGAEVHRFADLYGGPARLLRGRAAGLDLMVLDAPHLYSRPGGPYQDPSGRDWPENPGKNSRIFSFKGRPVRKLSKKSFGFGVGLSLFKHMGCSVSNSIGIVFSIYKIRTPYDQTP